MAGPCAKHAATGTFLPRYHGFDPAIPFDRLGRFCEKYGVKLETIRRVVVEPALQSGEVVSFKGDAPLFAYACGKNSDAITRMAEAVIALDGIPQTPAATEARNALWDILREFSMGYGVPVEEHIGLISKKNLRERFNLSSVNGLGAGRLYRSIVAMVDSYSSSFGDIASAHLDVWAEEMQPDSFSAIFNMFVQGRVIRRREDGSLLTINPTHCRALTSPPFQSDTPYIVTTAKTDSTFSISDILPQDEAFDRVRLDLLLWRKTDTVVIADVTGSFP
jgi:hypothetical protein